MKDGEGNLIEVFTDGTAGPYMSVPVDRLDEVKQALAAADIAHISDDDAIWLNGQPSEGVINLGDGTDVQAAQAVLDALN